jgi:superfamily II DNA or RNA helicase
MTKPLIQIGYNPVVAKLYGADEDAKVTVSTLLSYFVDGYEFMEATKRGWDGKSTFFNYMSATFPRGFVDDVEAALIAKGYTVQRVCKPLPEPLGDSVPVIDSFGETERYDYQMKTVRALEKRGVMIARVATGGGKSRIARLAYARINRPTLFVTTRAVLMHQMKRGFESSGFEVGMMGDGEWEPDPHLNVAMIQTLIKRLAEPELGDNSAAAMRQRRVRAQTIKYLETVEFVIGEEAHEAGGNSYYEFLKHCRRAEYRLALTATPFMRDSQESNMRLKAAFGSIGIDISEKLLIDRGILAKPIFKYVDCAAPKNVRKTTPYARAVEIGIVENEIRNKHALAETIRAVRNGLTVMILVARKKHGTILRDALRKLSVRADFIYGDSDTAARDKALNALGSGDLDVVIGTTILDVGVDVPAVGMVILAGGGKAEVALRQRIGRGLREKKSGPNICLIVDFTDSVNSHLRKHAASRRAIVEQTPGFAENILQEGHDFDYRAFGFGGSHALAS